MWLEFAADRAGDLIKVWRAVRCIARVFPKRIFRFLPTLLGAFIMAGSVLSIVLWWWHIPRQGAEVFESCGAVFCIFAALVLVDTTLRQVRHQSTWPRRRTDGLQSQWAFGRRLYWHNIFASCRGMRARFISRATGHADGRYRHGGSVTQTPIGSAAGSKAHRVGPDAYIPVNICGVQIPRELELSHGLVIGDDLDEREAVFEQLLRQVTSRGDRAVVLTKSAALKAHYRAGRDIMVDACDSRSIGVDLVSCFRAEGFQAVLTAMAAELKEFTAHEKQYGVLVLIDGFAGWRDRQLAAGNLCDLEAILSFQATPHGTIAACLRDPELTRLWGRQETKQTQRFRALIYEVLRPFAGFGGLPQSDFWAPEFAPGRLMPGTILYLGFSSSSALLDHFYRWLMNRQSWANEARGASPETLLLLIPELLGPLNLTPRRIDLLRRHTRVGVSTFIGLSPRALAAGAIPTDVYCTRILLPHGRHVDRALEWMGCGNWVSLDANLVRVIRSRLIVTTHDVSALKREKGLVHFHSNTHRFGTGRVKLPAPKRLPVQRSFARTPSSPPAWTPGLFDVLAPEAMKPARMQARSIETAVPPNLVDPVVEPTAHPQEENRRPQTQNPEPSTPPSLNAPQALSGLQQILARRKARRIDD